MNDPTYERFQQAWRGDKLVVLATMAEGPHAGREVVCITPRQEMLTYLVRASRSLEQYPGFLDNVRGAIKRQVSKGLGKLNKRNDKNFMDDLAILMACKLSAGEAALAGSGLFSLGLMVDPDESVDWSKRGFLREQDLAAPISERM